MVIAWIHLLLFLPAILISAEFNASVRQNEVSLNDSFNLELTLKSASPKSLPEMDVIKDAFQIKSERQSFSTSIINGKATSSNTWTYVLIAKELGVLEIPAIGIETTDGRIFSQPIKINVVEQKSINHENKTSEIRLESDVSRLTPYKNEPFFLKLRLTSKQMLSNIRVDKFTIDHAIVEVAGEPEIKEHLENGVKTASVEFRYLITPLKSGLLKIPRIQVLGDIPEKNQTHALFDDPFALFSLMPGFVNLQPFGLQTKELELDIKKPEALNPWLPASQLEIQENFNESQVVYQGEVFNRTFVISAEGIHSSQLPSLEAFQDTHGEFKVYADKPDLKDEIVNGKLKSYRVEQYTIIPKKTGVFLLPEISVNWWNTDSKEIKEAKVNTRKLQVHPAINLSENQDVALLDVEYGTKPESTEAVATTPVFSSMMTIFLACLIMIILALTVALLILLKQIKNSSHQEEPKKVKISNDVKIIKKSNVEPVTTAVVEKKKDKLNDLNPT